MITVLILLITNFGIFCEGGLLIFSITGKKQPSSITLITLSGLIGINLVTALLHFVIPMQPWGLIIICTLILVGFFIFRKEHIPFYKNLFNRWKRTPRMEVLAFLLLALLLAFNTSSRPMAFDAGSYHFQAIQWNEAYAIVPGLANLIRQLGFNSNWYVLQAFSGFSSLGIESIYPLNGLLLLLFTGYLLPDDSDQSAMVRGYKLIAIACSIILSAGKYAGEVTSDFPVILLISWTFLLVLQTSIRSTDQNDTPTFLVFILPVYLITLKISAVPVLIITLFIWIGQKSIAKIKYAIVAGLIMVIWLAGNVVLTGFLVFPFGSINLFDVDWKVPDLLIRDENYSITGWGRGPNHPVEIMATIPFKEWFPIWIKEQKIYNWLFSGLLVLLMYTSRRQLKKASIKTEVKVLTVTIGAGIIFWFVNVPDFRFVYGYLIPVLCATGSLSMLKIKKLTPLYTPNLLRQVFLLITGALFITLMVIRSPRMTNMIWLYPIPYPKPELRQIILTQSQEINIASWEQKCWDTPLPCTCEYYEGLSLRGPSMQEGFRINRK